MERVRICKQIPIPIRVLASMESSDINEKRSGSVYTKNQSIESPFASIWSDSKLQMLIAVRGSRYSESQLHLSSNRKKKLNRTSYAPHVLLNFRPNDKITIN